MDVKRRIVSMLITVTLTLTLEVGDVEVENNKKASSNNIMERRAQPNGTIMALKRVEIGLVYEACPIVPVRLYNRSRKKEESYRSSHILRTL